MIVKNKDFKLNKIFGMKINTFYWENFSKFNSFYMSWKFLEYFFLLLKTKKRFNKKEVFIELIRYEIKTEINLIIFNFNYEI